MNPGKRLEHLLKKIIASILYTLLKQSPRSPEPPYKKILFLRFDVLGDMILSIPVFKAMRHAFPEAEIDVVCSRKNYILLEGTDLADNLYISEKNPLKMVSLTKILRKKKYDLIINLVTRPSFTFGILARLAGSQSVRVAADQERFSYLYNHIINLPPKSEIHMLKRKFLLCAEFIGEDVSEVNTPWMAYTTEIRKKTTSVYNKILIDLDLPLNAHRLAGLNLSAGLARREWPLDNYIRFLHNVISRYSDKIDGWAIFTNPAQPDAAKYVLNKVNHPKVTIIPAQADFRIIVELIRRLFVLVSPDTSIAHAASAMGTPIMNLMIGENIKIWDPIGVPNTIILSKDPFTLHQLPVEDVIEGFDKLFAQITT